MPRSPRTSYKNTFHHIMVQGINKEYIFSTNVLKKQYIKLLNEKNEENNIKIVTYCIMGNHAHLLLYSKKISGISEYMQKVNMCFARHYNSANNRVGYVFRDRYKLQPILDNRQLKNCIAYIHNNPVKANIVVDPSQYKYSGYNNFLNLELMDKEILEIIFGSTNNYIEIYKNMHKINQEYKWIDIVENYDVQEIINEYLKQNNYTIEDVKKEKYLINELIKITLDKAVTINKISKALGMSRTKIVAILKKYE